MSTNGNSSDDLLLVKRAMQGDVRAVEEFIERFSPMVTQLIRRHVPHDSVPDVVSEALLAAAKGIPRLRDPERLLSWMRAIAVRKCRDYWRVVYRDRRLMESALMYSEEPTAIDRGKELDDALRQLSPDNRMIIVLHYFEGYPLHEVSGLLGISFVNAKVRLYRARQKLRMILEEKRDET